MSVLQLSSLRSARTLGVQAGLAGLVLSDLVHSVLLAILVLAESTLGLRNVHLHTQVSFAEMLLLLDLSILRRATTASTHHLCSLLISTTPRVFDELHQASHLCGTSKQPPGTIGIGSW